MNLLSCLKSFIATVDCGSFSAGARKLYISASKISKQITWLEEDLKVKLFIRSTTRLVLTEQGQMLYKKTMRLFDELQEIKSIHQHSDTEPRGTIQVYFTVTPLVPYLTHLSIEFMKKYPQIRINIVVGSESIAIYNYQFDIAFSFQTVKHPKLIYKDFFSIQRQLFASPAYIKQHGCPKSPTDLSNHNCLVNTLYGLDNNWLFHNTKVQVEGNFISNNATVLKQAAIDSLGIIWAPLFSVQQEILEGKLIPVLPEYSSPPIMIYAISPSAMLDNKNIRLLLNFYYTQALNDGITVS
ncbi:transcriptional regulator [Legionella beliardensis]|uniref:Transcriptional regulator n=1 Tax=Legionella beliardensis TaxID=91822 RepID=A0A378HZT8_9GAMM|nr:LysR family transcriptional regulator [Legionella beliardensis]STX27905.1 transcriptional regulator [Legionella beliardensis]